MNLADPENTSRNDIAEILGITPRHVTNLHKNGIFTQTKKGKYNLSETVQTFNKYSNGGKVHAELVDDKKKLDGLKIRKEAVLVAKLEGESLDREEVRIVVTTAMQVICTSMDGQAGRIAHLVSAENDPAINRQTLLDENRKIRESAVDKLKLLGSIRLDSRKPEATTKKKSRSVGKSKPSVAKRKRRAGAVAKRTNTKHDSNRESVPQSKV